MRLVEILEELGIEFRREGEHHHVSSGWLGVDCQECSPNSGHYRLGINLTTLKASCWQCGPVSAPWALARLAGKHSDFVRERLGLVERESRKYKPAGRLVMPSGLCDLTDAHRKYLRGRGLDPDELVRLWKVQATAQVSEIPWHVVIPVHHRRDVVSWTARKISDKGRRYFTATDERSHMPVKRTLYGLDYAGNSVIIHEGPVDVWKTGPGAVATFGTGFTHAQVLILSRFPRRVVCLDADAEAQKRARALVAALKMFDGITINIVLDSPDAGSASEREINRLRRELT